MIHSLSAQSLIVIYAFHISDYVERFATEETLRDRSQSIDSSDSESSLSDFTEDATRDMEL